MQTYGIWRTVIVTGVLLMATFCEAAAIKLGVLPSSDAMLIHVANDEGLFKAQGLDVEVIPFQSALEVNAAMRANRLDGQYCDVMTVLMQNDRGIKQKLILSLTYPKAAQRAFGLAVAPTFAKRYQSLADLDGVQTAMSANSIIDYLLGRMIETQALPKGALRPVEIRQIQVRLQTVLSGQMPTAMLPEPFLTMVEAKGGRVLWDDRQLGEAKSYIALRTSHLTPDTVRGFKRAICEAAKRVAHKPDVYRATMVAKRLLPKEAASTFEMLTPEAIDLPQGLPGMATQADVTRMANWLKARRLIREPVHYDDVVYREE